MTEQKEIKQAGNTYKLVGGKPTEEVIKKHRPQCQQIIKIIAEAPNCEITRFDLLSKLTAVLGEIKQPVHRVLNFYTPQLKKEGLVEVIKPVKEKKVKAAKTEAPVAKPVAPAAPAVATKA